MMLKIDDAFLLEALAQAKPRQGFCSPNPAVGAVLVCQGKIIARGAHFKPGFAHAEIVALHGLSPDVCATSTLYVTLEPCSHYGRTPPCVERIIAAGIKHVVFGLKDPNPQVSGQKILQEAGVTCTHLSLEAIDIFYQPYVFWHARARPFVVCKLALSREHRVSGNRGKMIKITGDEADKITHQQRLRSDVILTTATTIKTDNPQLTARVAGQACPKPLYIIDRNLSVDLGARLFLSTAPRIIFHGPGVDEKKKAMCALQGIQCVQMPLSSAGVSLSAVMDYLGEAGVQLLLVEAGPTLFESMIQAKLAQRYWVYQTQAEIPLGKAFNMQALEALQLIERTKVGCDEWRVYAH